jgi:hypothetical protein
MRLMMGMVLMILTTFAIGNIPVVDSGTSLEPGSNRTLFVVSTSNSLKRTIQLLEYFQNLNKSVDILLIDSSSTDGTPEFLQGKVQMISFIWSHLPLKGYAVATTSPKSDSKAIWDMGYQYVHPSLIEKYNSSMEGWRHPWDTKAWYSLHMTLLSQ